MSSKLVGTSSSTRTLDERDLSVLRPAKENAPRPRKPRSKPADKSVSFFCSNPQCDHATWEPAEQARHMAAEFWEVMQALVRLAPESPEALKLTGGIILKDLTDDECRAGAAEYWRIRGGPRRSSVDPEEVPVDVRLRRHEYERRRREGILTPPGPKALAETCWQGHPFTEENTYIQPGSGQRHCRECGRATRRAYQKNRWRSDPEYRERVREVRRRSRERNPETQARAAERARQRYAGDPELRERRLARNRKPSLPERACEKCGALFVPQRSDKRFCSRACKNRSRRLHEAAQ